MVYVIYHINVPNTVLRFLSAKICLSSIICISYMNNFLTTLSEISHLSLWGLQHGDRCSRTPTFTMKGSIFIHSERNIMFDFIEYLVWTPSEMPSNVLQIEDEKENCNMHVKTGLICSKDCLKWSVQSLQPFPLQLSAWVHLKKKWTFYFCSGTYLMWAWLLSIIWLSVLFSCLWPSCCIFFVDRSICVYFLLPPFTFLITKEHVGC